MRETPERVPQGLIWGLVAAAALVQAAVWTAFASELLTHRAGATIQVLFFWIVVLVLAGIASRRIGWLSRRLTQREHAHLEILNHVEQLAAQNAMLDTMARSRDVTLAFQTLARRIARLVSCDRVGLALLKPDGQTFQTFTARVQEDERRNRPRPELEFGMDATVIGHVVRSQEPFIADDLSRIAGDYLDANVLHSAGFQSGLVMPLVARGRSVGTLNVVARTRNAFTPAHAAVLQPIAELLAVGYAAQQLHTTLVRHRVAEGMAEMTLSIANQINSAVQTIVGHCDLLEREYPDADLQRDLAVVARQAQRIADLLEKMRAMARDRVQSIAAAAAAMEVEIPASPEGFWRDEG